MDQNKLSVQAESTALVDQRKPRDLITKMATQMGVTRQAFWKTVKTTLMPGGATDEQILAFLAVADAYNLNPFLKQIAAFEGKQGQIVPVVPLDGWSTIINRHPMCDGFDFEWADEIVQMDGGKPCPAWCKVRIYRKDRTHPVEITEFLDEVYQPAKFSQKYNKSFDGPWQTHTKRMLRHKTIIQGGRVGLGITGIYDPDEAERFVDITADVVQAGHDEKTAATAESIKRSLTEARASVSAEAPPPDEVVDDQAEFVDDAPADPDTDVADPDDDWSLLSGDDLKFAAGRIVANQAEKMEWQSACKVGDAAVRHWARVTAEDHRNQAQQGE